MKTRKERLYHVYDYIEKQMELAPLTIKARKFIESEWAEAQQDIEFFLIEDSTDEIEFERKMKCLAATIHAILSDEIGEGHFTDERKEHLNNERLEVAINYGITQIKDSLLPKTIKEQVLKSFRKDSEYIISVIENVMDKDSKFEKALRALIETVHTVNAEALEEVRF